MRKFYSIIIPVKNQELKINNNINRLLNKVKKTNFILDWEIILIDDCSTDKTFLKILEIQKNNKKIKIFKNKVNRGKGYSIKKGVSLVNKNSNKIVLIDSDIPYYNSLGIFLKKLHINNLVIINRKHKKSRLKIKEKNFYIYYRIFIGHILNLIFRFLGLTKLKDTQAGLKGFDINFKDVLKKVRTNGFLYDLEFLMVLEKKKINPILIPCTYTISKKSSIGFNLKVYLKILFDLFKIIINFISKNY